MLDESNCRLHYSGGGIGALALALVIRKYSKLPVDIFEAGPIITTIGAGIGFYARTMDIMKELGLYDEFVKLANVPPEENTGLFIFPHVQYIITPFNFRCDL